MIREKFKSTSTFLFNNDAAIFEISGFHYSAGTINIKLVVPSSTKPSSTQATDSPQKTPAAKSKVTTITCVKGKTNKKVTAVKPKCPAGFKKK
jgi:hypothetical protein